MELGAERHATYAGWRGRTRKCRLIQAMIELLARLQVLQADWERYSVQALVEQPVKVEHQALKASWQLHSVQALVEHLSKRNGLKAAWQNRFLQALIEV